MLPCDCHNIALMKYLPSLERTTSDAWASKKGIPMQVIHSSRPAVPRDRLLRLADVEAATGCKKSTIYKLMKEGKFPRCVYITSRMVAWPETAVLSWVQARITESAVNREAQPC